MTIFIVIMIANIPAGNYMFKVNNRNTRASCEIFSNIRVVLVSVLLTMNIFHTLL